MIGLHTIQSRMKEEIVMSLVLYRNEGYIAYISLDQPENLNAINRAMTKELSSR